MSRDYAPDFYSADLPPEDLQGGRVLSANLYNLGNFADDFEAALRLFDTCERHPDRVQLMFSWQRLAARDGAMTLFHFLRSFEGVYACLSACPTIAGRVDRTRMAEGSRHFHEAFPGVVKLRHGVAHAGEAFGTPANVEKNAASGSVSVPGLIELSNVGTAIVTGNLVNRKYTTMIEGKLFTYELSASSLSSLRRVQEVFWDTFRPIASR